MASERILWQLRYRSPLSPTRGVDDVVIETATDDPVEAEKLAKWWLEHKVPSPSTRFVYVRRLVVATTADMRATQSPVAAKKVEDEPVTGPSPAQAASRDDMTDTVRQEQARATTSRSGRVGA